MLIETFLIEKLDSSKKEKKTGRSLKTYLLAFLNLILAGIAGYLCWNCNAEHPTWLRVIVTILAVIFSGIYVLFYLVYRIIIGVPCATKGLLKQVSDDLDMS